MEGLTDEALVAGMAAGDANATASFVRRFQARVFGVALAVTGDRTAAEDVAQQAFVRAWQRAETFDPLRGTVHAWLSAIARNMAIDACRVRVPLPVEQVGTLPARVLWADAPGPTPAAKAVAGEAVGDLRAALRALPAEQARAVVLAGVGGLSASQVAAAEGIPLGTAKTRIRTGLRRLRASMAQMEFGDA
jgi:RNA polymerase sigma-70 factor (ECF subfamily)